MEETTQQPKKRGRGAKPKLTQELIEEVCAAVSIGTPNKYAAVYAGISEEAYYKYYRIGEQEIARLAKDSGAKPDKKLAIYVQFVKSIAEARSNRVVTWVDVVNRGAVTDPRLALEMLARTEPEDFSPQHILTHKVQKEVTQELEKALNVLEQGLDADTYAKVIGLLAGEAGGEATAEDTAKQGE